MSLIPAPYVSLGPSYEITFSTTSITYGTDSTYYGLGSGFGTPSTSGAVTVDGTGYDFTEFYSSGPTSELTLPLGDSDMATAVLDEIQATYTWVRIYATSWIWFSTSVLGVSGSNIVRTSGGATVVSLASDVGNNVNIEWA